MPILLIWAAIALIAYFTVDKIVEGIDASTKDETELVNATSDLCQKNNLTAEQCQKLVQQNVQQASTMESSSSGIGFFGLLAIGLALLAAPKILEATSKSKSDKK